MVVNPANDIQPHVQAAEKPGMKINVVHNTHVHADHISGEAWKTSLGVYRPPHFAQFRQMSRIRVVKLTIGV